MDRIIGIDYGKVRTGLAVSDPLRIFASALDTVPTAKIIDYLQKYAIAERPVRFVVGWPVNTDGSPCETVPGVQEMVARLSKAFPGVPVDYEDERFTTVLAHRAMIDGGMKKSQRRDKNSVDKISAAIILQGWLDRENRNRQ